MGLAKTIMFQVYGRFELVPSPWSGSTPKRRAYVNPTRDAMERAAQVYFERRDYTNLLKCLKNLQRLKPDNLDAIRA